MIISGTIDNLFLLPRLIPISSMTEEKSLGFIQNSRIAFSNLPESGKFVDFISD